LALHYRVHTSLIYHDVGLRFAWQPADAYIGLYICRPTSSSQLAKYHCLHQRPHVSDALPSRVNCRSRSVHCSSTAHVQPCLLVSVLGLH